MARLDEIAEGLATVLVASPLPEPLNITLKGEGPLEATFLVRAVIDSCERRGAPVHTVRVAMEIGADLIAQYGNQTSGYQGVNVEGSNLLAAEIEFYRSSPNAD